MVALTDLSKACDYRNHELLIAKLATDSRSHESPYFIQNYSPDRKQRSRINHTYNSCSDVRFDLPSAYFTFFQY